MSKNSFLVLFFISFVPIACATTCPSDTSLTSHEFCSSFKAVAECHCTSTGLPRWMCNDMKKLYDRMVFVFGSVEKACQSEPGTDIAECLAAWQCYRDGGKTNQGELCSSTGNACE